MFKALFRRVVKAIQGTVLKDQEQITHIPVGYLVVRRRVHGQPSWRPKAPRRRGEKTEIRRLKKAVRGYQDHNDELTNKLTACERELTELKSGRFFLITAEEHRNILLEAIERSLSELTLVSPWIRPDVFDDDVRQMLVDAIKRGVKVRIAWGLGVNSSGTDSVRNREDGNGVLSDLRKQIPEELMGNLIVKCIDTHEKFIICDNLFCAWGSFNWLSYRGAPYTGHRRYRREVSSYSEKKDHITKLKANAATLFGAD